MLGVVAILFSSGKWTGALYKIKNRIGEAREAKSLETYINSDNLQALYEKDAFRIIIPA